ncbi:MAG: helicase [Microcystis sp. M048S1]|nr:helicase [Microcystis aeruginosa NIES-88]MCA2723760.1 helicase [Microcystis sp. M176S2]MCA2725278.1 helicase [Microcystis sp. M166S2]MCA2729213.1 helicase [Microcystis sp. M162S2]MCA2748551.1 helicase [Microcystis sp. M155S2]MCA2767234.1 helicase [Microcystis sp. M152S2]MCA2775531.1 helicase [Microcystis sp. M135S2]MCA2778138.1 helicase [Microcystis sp. M136S2]MCA2784758.1 helicase [Microcystis sp. M125S2]MCA2791161.1 helicase [Microcystis sp. M112S2]MCA2799862.1 helicase [Microcystis 
MTIKSNLALLKEQHIEIKGGYSRVVMIMYKDQYKEKESKDKTIAQKFNTYHFVKYKEQVVDLLTRGCTVSVETRTIIEEMKKLS